MNRKEAAELLPIIQAFVEGKIIQVKWNNEWVDIVKDDTVNLIRILECQPNFRIKPEETSDNNPSASTSEYHYECFDNGCTLAGGDIKMCAIGYDDSNKILGEFILADISHHCNLTCSNKVKITVKIESED